MVATPIGNMEDVSKRMISTLKSVDIVFAEDTRVGRSLLNKLAIKTRVERYDHHSHDKVIGKVIEVLEGGSSVAYISDAGTPGVEDPGGRLVQSALQAMPELRVVPVSGPSAVMTALSVSGFPADKFVVLGFPPKKKGRQSYFDKVAKISGTIAIYESTHRIEKTVNEIAERQPNRQMMLAREMTKKFETFLRGTASDVRRQLATSNKKGEFIIVLE